MLPPHVIQFLSLATSAFVIGIGGAVAFITAVFAYDIIQKRNAV